MSSYGCGCSLLSTQRVDANSMKNIYLLKDLANVSGYSTYTLKYYLRLGLIQEIGRSPVTNFRFFDDSSLSQLKEIRNMRLKKLSIREIQQRLHKP